MTGDIHPAAEPDIVLGAGVFDEFFERLEATRSSDNAAMEPNRHHFGLGLTFGVERIKTIFEIIKKLVAGIETLRGGKSHIVGIKRVGHN